MPIQSIRSAPSRQAQDAVGFQRWRVVPIELRQALVIEARQAALGPGPHVPVAGLEQALHRVLRQAAFGRPVIEVVLGLNIDGNSGADSTGPLFGLEVTAVLVYPSLIGMTSSDTVARGASGVGFVNTRWSVVLSASDPSSPQAATALETLCRAYWYPLYVYARRRGHAPPDAQDLTQDFFARLLAHNWLARADPHKGRFRSFLLMAMSRFLANEWDKARTLKRGAAAKVVPLTLEAAETRYAHEPADTASPEQVFEKRWALATLDEVLEQLRADYERNGKGSLFAALKPSLLGSRETQPYAVLAADLGMSEGAVRVAVARLRERYRQRLRETIAHTVASPSETEAELRHLARVLSRG